MVRPLHSLIAAPYTILDLPAFLNGYAHLAGYTRPSASPSRRAHLLQASLPAAWPGRRFSSLLGGLGLRHSPRVRGPGRVRWTVTIAFPVLYYYFLSGQTLVFGRYLLPLMPFVCVLAAVGAVSGVSLLRRFDIPRAPRTAIIAAHHRCSAAAAGVAIARTSSERSSGQSTVEQAHSWILSDVPRGSTIVIETQALLLSRSYKSKNVPQLVLDARHPAITTPTSKPASTILSRRRRSTATR